MFAFYTDRNRDRSGVHDGRGVLLSGVFSSEYCQKRQVVAE